MVFFSSSDYYRYYHYNQVTTHRRRHANGTCKVGNMCESSVTSQEFIFKEYLQDHTPDVVLYFASSHDFIRYKLQQSRLNFINLFGLMETYLPLNTTLIVMNTMKQLETKLVGPWLKARYDNGAMNVNDVIRRQNDVIFEVLESRLIARERKWYVYPNLYDSSTATDHMYKDAVHRTPDWYKYIVGTIMHLLCS